MTSLSSGDNFKLELYLNDQPSLVSAEVCCITYSYATSTGKHLTKNGKIYGTILRREHCGQL